MSKISVVIAEDDLKISEIQSRFLERLDDFELVGIANSISEAKDIIEVFQPELILLDVYFPDGNGIDLLWHVRRQFRNIDAILVTAAKEVSSIQDAIRGGAFDYILKPMTFARFQKALENYRDQRQCLESIDNVEQTDVDQFFRSPIPVSLSDKRMPKSIDPITLQKVEEEMDKLNGEGINAESMGRLLGISRTTARRYLEFLVTSNRVTPNLVYGSIGRPERLYFAVN